MTLAKARVGQTHVFLNRGTEEEFTVVAVTGAQFGLAVFSPDEEETARACYANTVRAACKETHGY